MTAGSYCYIGSQVLIYIIISNFTNKIIRFYFNQNTFCNSFFKGIVHGTTLTLLNAARKYLKRNDMKGIVYVTSGLGGMSGVKYMYISDIYKFISIYFVLKYNNKLIIYFFSKLIFVDLYLYKFKYINLRHNLKLAIFVVAYQWLQK
jgi:urocanate hydratase